MSINFNNELLFGLDNFGNQKKLEPVESFVQNFLNLLKMEPGFYPSIPELGINISKYLHTIADTFNPGDLKEEIKRQCYLLSPYLDMGDLKVYTAEKDGQSILLITMSLDKQMIGITFTTNAMDGNILSNYKIEDI